MGAALVVVGLRCGGSQLRRKLLRVHVRHRRHQSRHQRVLCPRCRVERGGAVAAHRCHRCLPLLLRRHVARIRPATSLRNLHGTQGGVPSWGELPRLLGRPRLLHAGEAHEGRLRAHGRTDASGGRRQLPRLRRHHRRRRHHRQAAVGASAHHVHHRRSSRRQGCGHAGSHVRRKRTLHGLLAPRLQSLPVRAFARAAAAGHPEVAG
mmetsp:Transcript_88632/g.225648  ORF Transcript_88632/g.225648 Transcript_88632/m.225648 type:complete len:207 (+) Transcript_88632:24-644(+)